MNEHKHKTNRRFWRKAAVSCISLALVGTVAAVPTAQACIPWFTDWNSPVRLVQGPVYPQALAADDYEAQQKRREANPVDETFYTSMDTFAYKTASELLDGTGNEAYSPVSLYYALALACLGAEGDTKAQLLDLMGAEDTAALTQQAGNLYRSLYSENQNATLKLANSVWLSEGTHFRDSYKDAAAGQLYASVYQADFTDPNTGKAIGKWVGDNTGGLLSGPVEVDANTQALLLNTVYFIGQWAGSFMAENNVRSAFHAAAGDVEAEYMRKASQGEFVLGDGWKRASLALNNGSMTFVLPDEGTSVAELLASPEKLADALHGGEERYGEVYWQVPKFDMAAELELIPALRELGVVDAFDGRANFAGMAEEALYIDSALQKTRVKIDEKGVSAAAYTQLGMMRMSLPAESTEMTLDRPFLYAITAEDGTLLFVGVCAQPTVG